MKRKILKNGFRKHQQQKIQNKKKLKLIKTKAIKRKNVYLCIE